jgi:hypothetical protein
MGESETFDNDFWISTIQGGRSDARKSPRQVRCGDLSVLIRGDYAMNCSYIGSCPPQALADLCVVRNLSWRNRLGVAGHRLGNRVV